MSGVQLTTLPNGLRVVTDSVQSVETVSAGIWVGAGTRHEPANINGVAHLLEHMAFKGTARRSAADIAREIEDVGGQINAYTSREHTAYYAKVLKQDARLAFDILADILQNSVFDPQELARERSVVLQEIGQANDTPDDIVFDYFQGAAFPDQALGRPILGPPEIVEAMTREEIMDHMRQTYGAEAMVLAVAGNIAHEAVVALAQEMFGGIRRTSNRKTTPGVYRGGEYRHERDLEQLHLVLGFPAAGYHDEDFYAATVLTSLFGGGMSSRLFQEIRENLGLAYSIYAFNAFYADCGVLSVYAGTGPGMTGELVPAIAREIGRLPASLEESELVRARNQLKASTLMALESTSTRCEQMAQQLLVFDRIVPIAEQVAKIDAVDAAAVRRVAEKVFAGRPTLAAVGPLEGLDDYDRISASLATRAI